MLVEEVGAGSSTATPAMLALACCDLMPPAAMASMKALAMVPRLDDQAHQLLDVGIEGQGFSHPRKQLRRNRAGEVYLTNLLHGS